MDEIKTNVPKTFRYLIVLTVMVGLAAVGYTFLPDVPVSAQVMETKSGVMAEEPADVATQAMIDFSIGALKSASGYSVYAERGIVEKGNTEIRGAKADALRTAEGRKATKELNNSIDAFRQLPCNEVKSGDLTGKVFAPGVYCLSSAELAGEMVLDGQGSAASTFIFRVDGTLKAKSGSSVRVDNGAQSANVFFVTADAEIDNDVMFRANVFASGDIKVGAGSEVPEKVMALGKVEADSAVMGGAATGWLEICKRQQLPVAPANDLSNWIFWYVVSGVAAGQPGSAQDPVRVPVGSCSAPIAVAAGAQTVTELGTGSFIVGAGSFNANQFELYNVVNITPASPSTLGLVNLATRIANINMVAGGANAMLSLEFYNRRAIVGFIEICKRAAIGAPVAPGPFSPNIGGTIALPGPGQTLYNPGPGAGQNPLGGGDPDVTGFFQYTIEDVYSVNQLNPNIKTLQIFSIPVGQCTGPIAVKKGDPAPSPPTPRASLAYVSELPRAGAFLESIEVIPADRRASVDILGTVVGVSPTGVDLFIPAPGGGFVDVILVESATSANETLVIFSNRSNPSKFKVCKIAGPGIPVNTLFTFTVVGYGPTNAAHPQAATYGIVSRSFDVRAGDPSQGGLCEFVPGFGADPPTWTPFQTFVNGTPVYVFENGISINNTIPQNPGQLRVSRIRVFGSAFTNTTISGFTPNPDLTPAAATLETFNSASGVALPDTTTTNIPVNVNDFGLVSDVNVAVRLDHTFMSDLEVRMFDPAGRVSFLSDNRGGGGDNFGTGPNTCAPTTFTVFDDQAVNPISTGTAPFSGSFIPETPLAVFNGRGMNGTWTFQSIDQAALDTGTLGCAQLRIQNSAFVGRAAVFARASIVEVEFTNFRFNPTTLKVCKIGNGAAEGTNYNFTVALVSPVNGGPNPAPLFPAFSINVSVTAGPAGSQEGNCVFVNGGALLGGAFNQGSTVTITEAAGNLVGVTCPSCGPGGLTVDLPTRVATLSGPNGLVAGINAVIFTNNPALPPPADRPAKFDFDGDKKADPAVWSSASGDWKWAASSTGQQRVRNFGVNGDKLVAADYDGDGITDYAVWRPSNGRWYVQMSTNRFEYHQWGEAGDIPQVGDYDGDGRADFIIYRPSNGTWYIKTTSDQFAIFQFGIPTDKPYAADYDGDGRTDAGVFRNGTWYTLESSRGFRITQFGQTGDIPVPGDYDGDGRADFAVYRNGTWYVLTATTYTVRQHGTATDIPVPADYDGDGKFDIAFFRPSTGQWMIKKSGQGESSADDTISLGSAADSAVQAQ